MMLPSSPPLLPETDFNQPSSPPPLPSAPRPRLFHSASSRSRKRQFSDPDSQSSDPLFSDSTTNSESVLLDDEQPRKKRFIRGPWWHLRRQKNDGQGELRIKGKRHVRNADSGIWMGSDETDGSSETDISSGRSSEVLIAAQSIKGQPCRTNTVAPVSGESLAAQRVQICLDTGQERVDLSNLGLQHLSGSTLNLLHQLIRPSHVDSFLVPSEEEFAPLTPSIQLFLASNSLHALPPELYLLNNITVLSLRNNHFCILDPAISKLSNLKELNIAGNCLHYLPWEMTTFLAPAKGCKVTIRPNPFVSIVEEAGIQARENRGRIGLERDDHKMKHHSGIATAECVRGVIKYSTGDLKSSLKKGRDLQYAQNKNTPKNGVNAVAGIQEMIFLKASPVLVCGPDGRPLLKQNKEGTAKLDGPAPKGTGCTGDGMKIVGSACPSLREMCLRSIQSNSSVYDLSNITESDLSTSVVLLVQDAISFRSGYGNHSCSRCGNSCIIPRAYWLEFWYHGRPSQDSQMCQAIVPFMRMACSIACAQPSMTGSFII